MGEIINSFKQFYNLYLENYSRNFYSWLSPSGTFYPVEQSHGDWAREYLIKTDPKYSQPDSDKDYIDAMFRKGWFRITLYSNKIYCHNPIKKPSGKALKALIDECIEQHRMNIHWDNEDDDILLWVNSEY